MSLASILPRIAATLLQHVALCTGVLCSVAPIAVLADPNMQESIPLISYTTDSQSSRALVFMNNPEFLWATNDVCDLADETHPFNRRSCRTSLFRVDELRQGKYRAWWEHRNMMPFAIRSTLILRNPGSEPAAVELLGLALESNSFRRGGNEFVKMFSEARAPKILFLKPGEQIMLDELSQKWVHPSHFFAGVVDFNVVEGSVALDEIVFRKQPARTLHALGYSQRNLWGVHESLVYKGIANSSEVMLQGAKFNLDDTTSAGALPLSFRLSEARGEDLTHGFCNPERSPPCSGSAMLKNSEPTRQRSWVSHLAPDPRDTNPKRKRAVVADLIELVVPASTTGCPSSWPMPKDLAERACMRMSAHFHWFLEDFKHWRLPNWGNWAVHYKHPVQLTNSGTRERTVMLKITADGASPLAFRGTGISSAWKQVFLDTRAKDSSLSSVIIAKSAIAPGATVEILGEFILSGPGAGTLEHHVEIID